MEVATIDVLIKERMYEVATLECRILTAQKRQQYGEAIHLMNKKAKILEEIKKLENEGRSTIAQLLSEEQRTEINRQLVMTLGTGDAYICMVLRLQDLFNKYVKKEWILPIMDDLNKSVEHLNRAIASLGSFGDPIAEDFSRITDKVTDKIVKRVEREYEPFLKDNPLINKVKK